jgi:MazG family protein
MPEANKAQKELKELLTLIKKLRAPDGCPWDRKQKQEDIGKYILEEAYEVIDALAQKDQQAIREELGDLLFQILFLAEMGEESGDFTLADILKKIREKMIRRHPHIFGEKREITVKEVKENWQQIKKKEREGKSVQDNIFSNIPRTLPALKRAQKITAAAAAIGFDWPKTENVLEKLQEELAEFSTALNSNDQDKIREEFGDFIFTLVNLSRFIKVDAESALTGTTNKFLQRFAFVTNRLAAQGKTPADSSLAEMDSLWEEAKRIEI